MRCGYIHWVRNPWAQTSCKLWCSRVWCLIHYSFKSLSNLEDESVVEKTTLFHPHKFCFCNYIWYQQNVKLPYNTAFMEKAHVFGGVQPSPKQPLNYLRHFYKIIQLFFLLCCKCQKYTCSHWLSAVYWWDKIFQNLWAWYISSLLCTSGKFHWRVKTRVFNWVFSFTGFFFFKP